MKQGDNKPVVVKPGDGSEPIPAEIIENSIVEIAEAMRKIEKTRLTRRAIITLIHANSGVPKGQIELVLNNLDAMEKIWLKPR